MQALEQVTGRNWTAINGDCVEVVAGLPDSSVDFSVYSPPFSSLYIYSESERDMGNVDGDEAFQAAYRHLVREKLRVTKPGRLTAIHVKDLVYYSNASERGDRGLRDFTGDCIRTHVQEGWSYHCRVTVWRCPVREMTKAKPDGLLYKNFRTDAGRNRVGLPEYIVLFRKWADGMDEVPPITHAPMIWRAWAGEGARFVQSRGPSEDVDTGEGPALPRDASEVERQRYYEALDVWQNWASPVWMDTDETDVLNVGQRAAGAEKHLCPMPLDLTDRCIRMWSNPGDVVLSPFMGIGSEGVVALRTGRRFIGVELNPTYWGDAVRNLGEAEIAASSPDLFTADLSESA